jgi:uncharacterized membrane protein YbhN (UPF0104 family)
LLALADRVDRSYLVRQFGLLARLGGAALGTALVVLAASGLGLRGAVGRVGSFSAWALLAAVVVGLAHVAAQVLRLWSVFPPHCRPDLGTVARGFGFGQLMNMCLPARAGDVVKVVALSRGGASGKTSMTDATGAVLADKGIDALVMLFAAASIGGGLSRYAAPEPAHAALAVGGAALVAGVAWLLLSRLRPAVLRRFQEASRATLRNMRTLLTPARLSRGLLLGTLVVGAEVLGLVVLCSGLGISLGLGGALYVLVVLCLGIVIPVSVASIGPYEAAIAFALHRFGVSTADAIAIGVVHHAVQIATVGVFALGIWLGDRFSGRRRTAPCTAEPLLGPRHGAPIQTT